MTAVLELLQDIAQHLKIRTTVTPEQLRDLMKTTDLRRLANRMEELAEPATPASTAADATAGSSGAATSSAANDVSEISSRRTRTLAAVGSKRLAEPLRRRRQRPLLGRCAQITPV